MIDSSSITKLYTKINWYYIMIVLFTIVLIVLGYYMFTQHSKKDSNEYVANRQYANKDDMKSTELILFYVDWCPHCKTAKPEWEKVKEAYQGRQINGYTIIMTEHNCTDESAENEALLNKFKIEGYPTIKLLKDNQVIEFDAKPTQQNLEEFLNTAV